MQKLKEIDWVLLMMIVLVVTGLILAFASFIQISPLLPDEVDL